MFRVRVIPHPWAAALAPAQRILEVGLREAMLYGAGRSIVLGAHVYPSACYREELIYQTEPPVRWSREYRAFLMEEGRQVLSYAPGLPGAYCPLGYVSTPRPRRAETIDVFFAGAMSERRRAVLTELEAAGLVVNYADYLSPLFSRRLQQIEASARLVLNVHREEPPFYFESSRVIPAVSRGSLVLSEDAPGAKFCELAQRSELVELAVRLCRDHHLRGALREAHWSALRQNPMSTTLRQVLG